jgi:hypothetical protein
MNIGPYITEKFVSAMYNSRGDYIEIFKNPTVAEWKIVPRDIEDQVRGLLYKGDLYLFDPELLHFQVEEHLKIRGAIHLNMMEFTPKDIGIVVYIRDNNKSKRVYEELIKNKSLKDYAKTLSYTDDVKPMSNRKTNWEPW